MNITFRKETFRDDFTFRNSPETIRRFPFPFNEDKYMYSVNMEPHVPAGPENHPYNKLIDVDEHFVAEMQDRAMVLKEDPLRYQALPHMMTAQWDTLELLMEEQAKGYPEHFSLTKDGDKLALDQPPDGHRPALHFRRCRDAALRAAGIHHPPGPGRFLSSSTSATTICGWMPAW